MSAMSALAYRFVQVDVFTDRVSEHGTKMPLRARYVREYLQHMRAKARTWMTTSDAIYERMAGGAPAS
jgi:hypothetical protein